MELAGKSKEFEAQGLRVATITYDSPEVLRSFSGRVQIPYPMLSDAGSKVIRAFGILNEAVPKDNFGYGIPHPGVYVLDSSGKVKSKYFETRFQERFAAGSILVKELPRAASGSGKLIETKHLKLRTWLSDAEVVPETRLTIVAEVELPKKMHVYAPGIKGYIPIEWRIEESKGFQQHPIAFPASRMLHMKAIKETVPVFENRIWLTRDITVAPQNVVTPLLADGQLKIKGSLRYQACDDKICYTPVDVPLEWTLRVVPYDRQRVPVELQKR